MKKVRIISDSLPTVDVAGGLKAWQSSSFEPHGT